MTPINLVFLGVLEKIAIQLFFAGAVQSHSP
jgi:hypothetical protein